MRNVKSVSSVFVMATMFLTGCSLLANEKGFDELADGAGRILQPADVSEAALSKEPLADLGNKSPYSVNGRFYYVMEDPTHYRARGVASWYGKQFHGNATSSGEVFDMHALTAAHRNLPLPTYLEVTNLDNGKVAYVRTNDRGPYVDDRLIDLSYGAAVALGMADTGTANVEVRAVTGDEIEQAKEAALASAEAVRVADGVVTEDTGENGDEGDTLATVMVAATGESAEDATGADNSADGESDSASAETPQTETAAQSSATPSAPAASSGSRMIQIGAFGRRAAADSVRDTALGAVPNAGVQVLQANRNGASLYRVRVGPVETANIDATRASLATAGFNQVVVLPVSADGGDCVAGCQ